MENQRRFYKIERDTIIKPGFKHVGVYDSQSGWVLDLQNNNSRIELRTVSFEEFAQNRDVSYSKTIHPLNDDETVLQRWNAVANEYNAGKLKDINYFAPGTSGIITDANGLNCENLAEYVLTGHKDNPQGTFFRIIGAVIASMGITAILLVSKK